MLHLNYITIFDKSINIDGTAFEELCGCKSLNMNLYLGIYCPKDHGKQYCLYHGVPKYSNPSKHNKGLNNKLFSFAHLKYQTREDKVQ